MECPASSDENQANQEESDSNRFLFFFRIPYISEATEVSGPPPAVIPNIPVGRNRNERIGNLRNLGIFMCHCTVAWQVR